MSHRIPISLNDALELDLFEDIKFGELKMGDTYIFDKDTDYYDLFLDIEVENMYVMRRKDCWVRFNPNNPRQQYIICKPKMKETFEEILDKMNIQARRAQTPITTTLRARDEFSRGLNPNVRGGGLFPPPEKTPGEEEDREAMWDRQMRGGLPSEEEMEQIARGSGMMAVRSLTPSPQTTPRGEDPFSLLQFTKDRLKEEEEFMRPDPRFGGIPAPKDYVYPGEVELGNPTEYSELRRLQKSIEQRLRKLEKEGVDTNDLYEEYFEILGNNSIKEIINNNLIRDFDNMLSPQFKGSPFYKAPPKEAPRAPDPTLKSESKRWKGRIKKLSEGKKLSKEDKKSELEDLNRDFRTLAGGGSYFTLGALPQKGSRERAVYEDFKKEIKKL